MIASEIIYSDLEERFNAEYYKPEFIETEKNLIRINASYLRSVARVSKLRKDPLKEPNKEFTYVDISNVSTTVGDINTQKIIGYKAPTRARKLIQTNDVIISTVRPNRNAVAIVTPELNNAICSTCFSVVKATKINPYYLFIFFKTKYSINQLVRKITASMYPAVSETDIAKIFIPIPPKSFQEKIEKIVKEAHEKKNIADQKYEQAKQLLEKELRLDKLELKEEKTFEAKFSDLNLDKRFDVEFHKPIYSKINELLEKGEKKKILIVKRLKEIGKLSKGIEVGSDAYASEGYLFLRVSNLSEKEITIGPSSEFIRSSLYEQLKEKYKPQAGEVLYTKDATIGVSLVVENDFNEFIPSGGIVRIKPKEIDPYYLALALNSIICRSQSKRRSIGAVIKHFTFENIKNLKVPILPESKQEEISKLVRESFSLRKESKELLDKAKEEVENLIEGK